MPEFEAAAGEHLEGSDDTVTAEVMRRANSIFQVLVERITADPYTSDGLALQASPAHAASESPAEPTKLVGAEERDEKVVREVRRLGFETAVLGRKMHMLKARMGLWM